MEKLNKHYLFIQLILLSEFIVACIVKRFFTLSNFNDFIFFYFMLFAFLSGTCMVIAGNVNHNIEKYRGQSTDSKKIKELYIRYMKNIYNFCIVLVYVFAIFATYYWYRMFV